MVEGKLEEKPIPEIELKRYLKKEIAQYEKEEIARAKKKAAEKAAKEENKKGEGEEVSAEKPAASKRAEKMDFNKQLAVEHLKVIEELGDSSAIYEELKKMGLAEELCVKIADTLPTDKEVIKMIFYEFTLSPEEEQLSQIMEIVDKHRKKKRK